MTGEGDRPTAAERWSRVEVVLGRALDARAEERSKLLDEACAGDLELRREVEELLAAEAAAPSFLDDSAAGFAADALAEEAAGVGLEPGTVLGEYRLVKEIGAGGMSRVYLAERTGDDFEQRVAIKVLRAVGLDAAHGLERFRFERRVLASLDHPNIARVMSGGATSAGVPYLVMEFVEGEPITRFCARGELNLNDRLALARDVCSAVQFAHQRLIVHRDLKPSNILVTPGGEVKLLDFGIAKLLDPEALASDAEAPMTRTGLLLMTPDYAAPEQLLGREVTTATDVYALGVLLYELVTGERPYRTGGSSPATAERLVCETDPTLPSASFAKADGQAAAWRHRVRGDLDAVILKALRKAPAERYGSARELADDLTHFLDGLPVVAGPTALTYRAKKFVRRHRWPVAAGAAFVVASLAFGATMAWQQAQTRTERDRARAAEAKASAINRFLLQDLLGSAAPAVAQGREITLLEAAELAAARLDGSFSGEPELEASVRRALGEIHLGLGDLEAAGDQLDRALELFGVALGEDDPETLETRRLRAELQVADGDYEKALMLVDSVLEELGAIEHEDDLRLRAAQGTRAKALLGAGEYGAALEQLEAALATPREESPEAWHQRLILLTQLAETHSRQRQWTEAEAVASEALELQLRLLGPNHPDVGQTLAAVGRAQTKSDRFGPAEKHLRRALELQQRVLGDGHPDTLATLRLLTILEWDRGDLVVASEYNRQEYELRAEHLGAEHPRTISALGNLGMLYDRSGRAELALPILRQSVEANADALGTGHPNTVRALKNLASHLLREGKPDEARTVTRRTIAAGWERLSEAEDDQTFLSDFAYLLATCLPEDLRDPVAALPLAERAVELSDRGWEDALDTLAVIYRDLGRLDEAIAVQREAMRVPGAVATSGLELLLLELFEESGDLATAESDLLETLERRRAEFDADHPILGTSYRRLGRVRAAMGRLEEAEADLLRAIAQYGRTLPDGHPRLQAVRGELGEVLALQGRVGEGEALVVGSAEALEGRGYFTWERRARSEAFARAVRFYERQGRLEEMAEWKARAAAFSGAFQEG